MIGVARVVHVATGRADVEQADAALRSWMDERPLEDMGIGRRRLIGAFDWYLIAKLLEAPPILSSTPGHL